MMSSKEISSQQIEAIVRQAQEIAAGDYTEAETTARNHAALQAKIIQINGELMKTIRHLDSKNSTLQKFVAWLSLVATVATVVALLK
jgi:hypothetical protein